MWFLIVAILVAGVGYGTYEVLQDRESPSSPVTAEQSHEAPVPDAGEPTEITEKPDATVPQEMPSTQTRQPESTVAALPPPTKPTPSIEAPISAPGGLAGERIMGMSDAPVTIIEYSSLTCSHCADFHKDTLPRIKETYVDTGKVRLVFRDFPFEQRGTTAAMVARCVPPERFFGFLDVLFRTQDKWANDPRFTDALLRYARLGGLSEEAFKACLGNQELLDGILARQKEAEAKYEINSTPSFVINGTMVNGALPFEKFKTVIDSKLE